MEENIKKRGRPPKDPADKRTEVLFLKLTPEEKREVDQAAPEPSVWARDVILRAARRLKSK